MGRDLLCRSRLLLLALALALGGALGCAARETFPWVLSAGTLAMLLLAAGRGRKEWAWVLPALLLFYAGFFVAWNGERRLEGRRGEAGWTRLEGKVEPGNAGGAGGEVFLFRVEKARDCPFAMPGDRYLLRTGEENESPEWGDRLEVEGYLHIFPRSGGQVAGSLRAEKVRRLGGAGNPLLRCAVFLRTRWEGLAERVLVKREAALLGGILLGDYRRLELSDLVALRGSGLIHLCAASGLHVGILAVGLLWLGRKLTLSRRATIFLQVPLLAVYALMAGLSVPVLRASAVLLVAGAAFLLGRDFDFLSAAGAAVILLFVRQADLAASPSFQLSLAAALGVVLLRRPLGVLIGAGNSRFLDLVVTSLAAQAAVGPFLLHHFGELPLLAPVSNLLVLPVLPLLMGFSMFSLCLAALGIPGASLPLLAAAPLARWILKVAGFFSSARWSLVRVYPFSLAWITIYFPLLLAALMGRGRVRRWAGLSLAVLLSLLLACGLQLNLPALGGARGIDLTFLDVGQGDACLVQAPGGVNLLVDGGKDPFVLEGKLRARDVRRLDAVVVSHPEEDHAGGLEGALRACSVGLVLHPPLQGKEGHRFFSLAAEMGIPVREMKRGDRFEVGDVKLEALGPDPACGPELAANDRSLVLRMEAGGRSFLFPGDVEEEGMDGLLREPLPPCDLLKVPHHGGYAAGWEEFLLALRPRLAVISVGAGNSYGHPSPRTLRALRAQGCAVYRTDLGGDIVIRVVEGGFRVETSREGVSRRGPELPGERREESGAHPAGSPVPATVTGGCPGSPGGRGQLMAFRHRTSRWTQDGWDVRTRAASCMPSSEGA
ncbi:ComEC/Rec2 family competence protein [Candidatus Solincola sp.]|nr:ComEC/Rec2 family competence protein [Actinomycetota bacterium]MDI7251319.1 ComEC/Rec2 family competence protein [Actinomycetota bacterium]